MGFGGFPKKQPKIIISLFLLIMTTQWQDWTTLDPRTTTSVASNRQKCEVYTRVMGYHRPVSQFNEWKKSEYYSRTYFTEGKTCNSQFCEEFSAC